ncbi:hypothetical protein V6N13_103067 [Hibiscus sabdariffa]|uniref:Uncharacterized protein n=1 Tax=Hibiscus sabdariffa TaxID=183260 RepID=A0ABR2C6K2_9ROSI
MIVNGLELLSAAFLSMMMFQWMRNSHVKLLCHRNSGQAGSDGSVVWGRNPQRVKGEDKCGETETENSSASNCSNQEFDEL